LECTANIGKKIGNNLHHFRKLHLFEINFTFGGGQKNCEDEKDESIIRRKIDSKIAKNYFKV